MPPRGPRGNFNYTPLDPESRKRVLLRMWKYIYRHKWLMLSALLLTVLSNVLALFGPYLSGEAIDAIGVTPGGVTFERVFFYCFWMLIFYAASSLLSYALSVVMVILGQKITFRMRQEIFDHLAHLPVKYFDSHQTGDLISRISYDVDTVNASMSHDLLQIATSAITIIGSLIMMIFISPVLVLVLVVTVPASALFTKYMTKRVRPLFRKRSAKLGELNGFSEEIISGHKTLKAYHREQVMLDRFDVKNGEAVDAYYNADYYGTLTGPTVNMINNLSMALISMFGAALFLIGQLSVGNLSSFILYSRRFSGPINEMANIISELQSACAAAERIFRLIDEEPETSDSFDAIDILSPDGDVRFEDVSFGYVPEKTVIHDLSLHASPGKLVAIVGPTGAGKTTIVNLLMRFYDPNSGTVTLDEHNILQLTRKSLRLSYAMVLQDTWLFSGTIYENLVYGRKDAAREEVEEAARAAELHDYIMSLPEGYDTYLDENGGSLSQGQRQLLTIARAMLLKAHILILDEATSNVDTRTEKQLQAAMNRLMANKTCFIIAHRLSTIKNADTILVVRDGEIIEQGNHDELLQLGGSYAALYNSQFH